MGRLCFSVVLFHQSPVITMRFQNTSHWLLSHALPPKKMETGFSLVKSYFMIVLKNKTNQKNQNPKNNKTDGNRNDSSVFKKIIPHQNTEEMGKGWYNSSCPESSPWFCVLPFWFLPLKPELHPYVIYGKYGNGIRCSELNTKHLLRFERVRLSPKVLR